MISERDKKKIINYPPDALRTFNVTCYEWIDNLCFTVAPEECLDNAEEYVSIVRNKFMEPEYEGDYTWDGDGRIELMWIPPFVFDRSFSVRNTFGITVWHVKQKEDGISWILYPDEAERFFTW